MHISFRKYCQIVFESDYTNFSFPATVYKISIVLHLYWYLILFVLKIWHSGRSVIAYCGLICICLVSNDVKYLYWTFQSLLLLSMLFKAFTKILLGHLSLIVELCILGYEFFVGSMYYRFSLALWLAFSLCDGVMMKVFVLMKWFWNLILCFPLVSF